MIDILVIGGGPAGSAAAIGLARAGRKVTLLERETGPHDKVCGEFLSGPACAALRRLGVDPEARGARPVSTVSLSKKGRSTTSPLPFAAMSLSRRVMDEALLDQAAAVGVVVQRGVRASAVDGGRGAWLVKTDTGELAAAEVLIATGKHNLRGCRRGKGGQSDLIGFKLHLRLEDAQTAALSGLVELHLFEGGYAGLELVEDNIANLCLVVRKSWFAELGGRWDALWAAIEASAPQLGDRLAASRPGASKPLAISAIPYGYVGQGGDGLWRLGDQAAVIPSFAGEGMSIALQSGELAAKYLLADRGPDAFQRALAASLNTQVRGATFLSQALVRPVTQSAVFGLAWLEPKLLRWIADHTRTRPIVTSLLDARTQVALSPSP